MALTFGVLRAGVNTDWAHAISIARHVISLLIRASVFISISISIGTHPILVHQHFITQKAVRTPSHARSLLPWCCSHATPCHALLPAWHRLRLCTTTCASP